MLLSLMNRQHKERDVPEPVPVKGPLTEEQAAAEEAEEALRMNVSLRYVA